MQDQVERWQCHSDKNTECLWLSQLDFQRCAAHAEVSLTADTRYKEVYRRGKSKKKTIDYWSFQGFSGDGSSSYTLKYFILVGHVLKKLLILSLIFTI